MKVVRLVAENIKRIKVVNIEPGDANLFTIGGKNSAGKSSVLDAVAYAMGGQQLVPSEPIRAGEAEAKIVVDLGDLVVTRKFKREKLGAGEQLVDGEMKEIAQVWGDTTSTLSVTNRDGAKYPSPQAVLDKLLGKLTFDPLAFARAEPKEQDAILRRLVGIDVAPIEARRKAAFDARAMYKKTLVIKEVQLGGLPHYPEAPATETSMDEVSQEMLRAEEYRKIAEDAERTVSDSEHKLGVYDIEMKALGLDIKRIREQLAVAEEKYTTLERGRETAENHLGAKRITAESARAVVPDVALIRAKVTEVEATNAKVRANQKHAAAQANVDMLTKEIAVQHQAIVDAEAEKQHALASAAFPVPGLGLSDAGVVFNNVPFDQAGSAEQVRVSVAIGCALNPQLRVLLIRNGNLLDKDSLAAVAAQAEAAEMQVWCEMVSESADGVAVMLVDGEVA